MCVLKDIGIGQTQKVEAALLKRAEERKTKTGKSYLVLTITDGETEIQANLWDKSMSDLQVSPGTAIMAFIRCEEYEGRKKYTVNSYGPAPGVDPTSFVRIAPLDPEGMWQYLYSLTERVPEDIRGVVQLLWTESKERLLYFGAAQKVHHTYLGGLLYHLYRLTNFAVSAAQQFGMDEGMMIAGAMMHDIGKVRELITGDLGDVEYTFSGTAIGHTVMGLEMLTEARVRLGLRKTENFVMLENMVASHHLDPEKGAASRPVTKEAYCLAVLDNLDSKMDLYDSVLADTEPGKLSDRQVYLNGAFVYRPLSDVR